MVRRIDNEHIYLTSSSPGKGAGYRFHIVYGFTPTPQIPFLQLSPLYGPRRRSLGPPSRWRTPSKWAVPPKILRRWPFTWRSRFFWDDLASILKMVLRKLLTYPHDRKSHMHTWLTSSGVNRNLNLRHSRGWLSLSRLRVRGFGMDSLRNC